MNFLYISLIVPFITEILSFNTPLNRTKHGRFVINNIIEENCCSLRARTNGRAATTMGKERILQMAEWRVGFNGESDG